MDILSRKHRLQGVSHGRVDRLVIRAAVLLALNLSLSRVSAAIYYVAPDGDDSNLGTIDQPFATIGQARDTIRNTTGNTVYLRRGTYYLTNAITFTSADSGESGAPNVYRSYPGETAVFSGGIELDPNTYVWETYDHNGTTIYKTNVGDMFFRSLWVDYAKAQRARTPNATVSMADTQYFTSQSTPDVNQAIGYTQGDINPNWTNLQEVEIQFLREFTSRRQQIDWVDDVNNVLWMSGAAYSGNSVRYFAGNRYWIENVFEGLDSPGEWYLNTHSNDLYYYPINGKDPATSTIIVGHLGVARTKDKGVLLDNDGADYLEFHDLTFTHSDWYIPFETTGWDGYYIDFTSTGPMVYLRGGVDGSRFVGCKFEHCGGHGLFLHQGHHNTLSYCEFTDIGGTVVRIGHEGTLDGSLTSYNTMSDCTIEGYGADLPSIGKGIILGVTANCDIIHNRISNGSYMGIQIGRNTSSEMTAGNNTLQYNHIFDVALILSDAGAMYSTGDQFGTVYSYNKVHGIPQGRAIYPDDSSDGITFEKNLVYDCYWGMLFRGASVTVQNNIFASMQENGYTYATFVTAGNTVTNNIFYHTPLSFWHFFQSPKGPVDYNMYYDATGGTAYFTRYGWTFAQEMNAIQGLGNEANGVYNQDPLFVDPDNHDYRLRANSPALLPISSGGINFESIADEIAKVGPRAASPDLANHAPVFAPIGDQSVNEGTLLSFSVSATDADGDALSYSARALPVGATFSGQTFSWTPGYDQAGTYEVTFLVSDGQVEDFETISIEVIDVPTGSDPVLDSIGDKAVDEGQLLSFSIHATDADGDDITYGAAGLPSGASFVGTTFSWTPDYGQPRTYQVMFTARDWQGSDSEEITITVQHVNRPPVLAAIGDRSVDEGSLLSFSIQTSDPDGDAVSLSAENLPSGATFSRPSFSWAPSQSQVGTHEVTFVASDGQLTDTETITITVIAGDGDPDAPVVANCSPAADAIQVPINSLIALRITDADPGVDANTVTIAVNGATVYSGNVASYSSAYGVCRRTGTKADYTYAYQAAEDFDFDETITVTVNAADLAGNAMSPMSFSFSTQMRAFGGNRIASWGSQDIDKGTPATVCDSSGTIWTVWHAGDPGGRDIYVSRLVDGREDFDYPVQLTAGAGDEDNPDIAIGTDGKLYVVWQDNRRGNWDIYMKVSADGTSWSAERQITDSNDHQVSPAIVVDAQSPNRVYVAWQDDEAGNQDICVASSSDGFATETIHRVTANASDQSDPQIAVDSSNTVYLVWTDRRDDSDDIYGASSSAGPWTNVAVVTGPGNQNSAAIAAEAAGSVMHLLWVDDTSGNQDVCYASSNALPTTPLVGMSINDDMLGADQADPSIAVAGSEGDRLRVFACWQDSRNVTATGGDTDLYFIEVREGTETNILIRDDRANSGQSEPVISVQVDGHPYVVWTDDRNVNMDIYWAGSTFMERDAVASRFISASTGATVGVAPPSSLGDVSVVIPPNACPYDVTVTIRRMQNLQSDSASCISSYDFGPSGLDFDVPVTITIPYSIDEYSSDTLAPYWHNSQMNMPSQQGITDVETLEISPTVRAIRFKTTHFTPYVLLPASTGDSGGGGGGGCSLSAYGESDPYGFFLPFVSLALVMSVLRLRGSPRYSASHGRPRRGRI